MTAITDHHKKLHNNQFYPSDHPEHEPTWTTAEARTLDFLMLYGLSAEAAIDCLYAIQEGDCPTLNFTQRV